MTEPKPSLSDRYRRLPWLARVGLVLAAAIGVGLLVAPRGGSPDRAPAQPSRDSATSPAAPAGQIGSGVWLVGADVQPGTYRSTGPAEDGRYCMWSRHDTAAGGPLDGIIASDGSFDAGQMLVTIETGDALFRTSGCAPFQPVG